ncbi:MAG: hypothetical protein KC496_08890, partial [Anaerolineae bacterium]|nr:hypothetical protein [Anaerolineae bacterium]
IDQDIRTMHENEIEGYVESVIHSELSESYWTSVLPQAMNVSNSNSPYWHVYRATQVKMNDKGFLSRDITVRELIEYKSDVHHVFPRDLLKKQGLSRGQYNQIANYVIAQSEINIAIGNKSPDNYFQSLIEQVNGGGRKYGNIADEQELIENLQQNCIPVGIETMNVDDYQDFLAQRRILMAEKIHSYFTLL